MGSEKHGGISEVTLFKQTRLHQRKHPQSVCLLRMSGAKQTSAEYGGSSPQTHSFVFVKLLTGFLLWLLGSYCMGKQKKTLVQPVQQRVKMMRSLSQTQKSAAWHVQVVVSVSVRVVSALKTFWCDLQRRRRGVNLIQQRTAPAGDSQSFWLGEFGVASVLIMFDWFVFVQSKKKTHTKTPRRFTNNLKRCCDVQKTITA